MIGLTRVSVPFKQSAPRQSGDQQSASQSTNNRGLAQQGALNNTFIKPFRSRNENPLQVVRTFSRSQAPRSGALEVKNMGGWQKPGKKAESKSNRGSQRTKATAAAMMGAAPACKPNASIDEKPHPYCRLNREDALKLAKSAIEGQHFPERKTLMGKVKTPWDIITADKAIVEVLATANAGATPEQVKLNHMRALFLRDNVGQCVINRAMQTWHGKRVMASYVLKVLPSEMFPKVPAVRDLSGDGQLDRPSAQMLADSLISGKPMKDQHKLLERVIGFQDLVMLEEEAIQSLAKSLETATTPKVRAQFAMNFLFLLHEVGTQTANRVMTERSDRVAYMKHMVKSLFTS